MITFDFSPPRRHRLTEDERVRGRIVELARRVRPQERQFIEEPGSVRIPAELHKWLSRPDPILEVGHVGVAVLMLCMLENGRAVFPGGQVEGEGGERVVVIPRGTSLGKFDPSSAVMSYLDSILDHLAANRWLTVERQSGERRVGYGARMRPPTEPSS